MAMRKSSFLGVMGGRLELVEMSNTEPPSGRVLAPLKRRRQGRKSDRPYTHHQMVGALFHEVSPAGGRGRQTTKNDGRPHGVSKDTTHRLKPVPRRFPNWSWEFVEAFG